MNISTICPTCGRPRLLDLCGGEGAAAAGYMAAGFCVDSIDIDAPALKRNPANRTVVFDALDYLVRNWRKYAAFHLSAPCQRWAANGANPAASSWPDLITPGRQLLEMTGRPYVMENVLKAPLRRDLILCGSMFGLVADDVDGQPLALERHRAFESNVPLYAPKPCHHDPALWPAGVYGGGRKVKKKDHPGLTLAQLAPLDRHEARYVRKGGYVPRSAEVQSQLLGGVPWMTGKGRRECIPPVFAQHVGSILIEALTGAVAA